jgi:hypothetical protein
MCRVAIIVPRYGKCRAISNGRKTLETDLENCRFDLFKVVSIQGEKFLAFHLAK